jgi:hypothetical protein
MNKRSFLISVIIAFSGVFLFTYFNKYVIKKQTLSKKNLIFIGDSGTGNKKQKNVSKAIKKYCLSNKCLEGYILGDVIYDKGVISVDDDQFQQKFEQPYKDLNFPFYIMFGNHDYLGCKECYLKYSSRLWKMPGYFYKRNIENVDLFIIDTLNFDYKQQSWLKNELKKSQSTLKIVLGHHPIITFDEAHSSEFWSGKKELEEILCRNKVEMYFSGHSHILEYIDSNHTCGFKQIISGGGGADPRKIKKNNIDKFYLEKNGFVALEFGGNDKFTLKFIDDNNAVEHVEQIKK